MTKWRNRRNPEHRIVAVYGSVRRKFKPAKHITVEHTHNGPTGQPRYRVVYRKGSFVQGWPDQSQTEMHNLVARLKKARLVNPCIGSEFVSARVRRLPNGKLHIHVGGQ